MVLNEIKIWFRSRKKKQRKLKNMKRHDNNLNRHHHCKRIIRGQSYGVSVGEVGGHTFHLGLLLTLCCTGEALLYLPYPALRFAHYWVSFTLPLKLFRRVMQHLRYFSPVLWHYRRYVVYRRILYTIMQHYMPIKLSPQKRSFTTIRRQKCGDISPRIT